MRSFCPNTTKHAPRTRRARGCSAEGNGGLGPPGWMTRTLRNDYTSFRNNSSVKLGSKISNEVVIRESVESLSLPHFVRHR